MFCTTLKGFIFDNIKKIIYLEKYNHKRKTTLANQLESIFFP